MNDTIRLPDDTTSLYTSTPPEYGRLVRPEPPDWMTRCDLVILEFLYNERNRRLIAGPSMVEANINYSLSTVRQRMRVLERVGLLQYQDEDRGLYALSEMGEQFVDGEITGSELPEPQD